MLSTVNARGVPGDPSHSLHFLASEPGSVIKIGRHSDSNIILEHPDFPFLISRRHAEISIVDGKVSIVDTGSKNGVYLNGTRLQPGEVSELKDGLELCFGCTDTIAKDGRPERNPFVFSVHGLVALLGSVHAAAQDRAGQDTQEARPADGQPAAEPQAVPAATAPEKQEQERHPPAEPASLQGLPPQVGVFREPAAGAQQQLQQLHLQPPQQHAAEQHAMLPPTIAASEGPLDLTGSPDSARGASAAAPAAADSRRATEIVDLTVEDDEDDDDDVAVIAGLEAARLSTPAAGGSSQSDRKRKRPQVLAEGAARSNGMREGAAEDCAKESAAGVAGPSMLRKLEDDFECVICRDLLVGAHTLVPCGHVFCGQCLMDWLQKNATCPNCRTKVTAPPVPALLINNTAEGLEGGLSSEDAAERSRRKKEWKEVAGTAMAGWRAMFASGGGLRAAHQRGHRGLGTGVYHALGARMGLADDTLQAAMRAAENASIPQAPRRSGRNSGGRSAERATAAQARLHEQDQQLREIARRLMFQHHRDPEGHVGFRGIRVPLPHAEVPGMPGHTARQDSEISVGYHAGSRATCMGCPVPIAPGEVRMQRRSRVPPRGMMIQQHWHPQCFQGWATLPHPLPGVEQLRPDDQGAVQARMILP
ncbi:probable E3 ubiquitin-protein ligase RNF8 at C-terminar half [Coccomyxa sp. Obi]|nr:probable E3 ubiquitin-protein ligase RNF8 at C-terminar half [Coccomyxa sp. Obi]